MAQLSNDCFAQDGGALLRLDDALADLRRRLVPVAAAERLPLSQAMGCALAEPLMAKVAVPPCDNSAVDGYALRHADLDATMPTGLEVIGRAAAGHPHAGRLGPGQAVRIFTGAVMPDGADTVMMQEDCRLEGGRVIVMPGIKRGANSRARGEDIAEGAEAMSTGQRLDARHAALAAAIGHHKAMIYRPLRIALLSTGDEVHEAGGQLPPGGVYDANRPMLSALLRQGGFTVNDLGILPDRRDRLTATLQQAAATHDAVISSGGVSTGEEDHVKAAIDAVGRLDFWKLAIKPGRPVALGLLGNTPYIGLPGNPVAALLTYVFFARQVLEQLGGYAPRPPQSLPVAAGFRYRKKADRREWVRVSLHAPMQGAAVAHKYPVDGAGVITSLTGTDGIVELAEDRLELEPGEMLPFYSYAALGL